MCIFIIGRGIFNLTKADIRCIMLNNTGKKGPIHT